MKLVKNENEKTIKNAISDKEAEEAFIKIIKCKINICIRPPDR